MGDELASWFDGTARTGLADFFPSPLRFDVFEVPGKKSTAKNPDLPPRLRLDVVETEEWVTVTADLPGVARENVNVHIEEGNLLTVEAKRERCPEEAKAVVHRRERHFGEVSRQIVLPEYVNADECSAHFENGTLTLRFGKHEVKPARRRIDIQGPAGGGGGGGEADEEETKKQ